ncbi:MAG: type IX secretion system sortase PorU [Candidatus Krumholzibacteriia bacterium]
MLRLGQLRSTRLFRACIRTFACSIVLLAPRLSAREERDWVQVVRDDDRGMELVLRAPEPERDGGRLRVPGFEVGGDEGLPVIYERAVLIGVPGPRGAVLEVLDASRRSWAGVEPDRVPAPVSRAERQRLEAVGRVDVWREVPARTWTGSYPASAVSLSGVARLRGRDTVTLSFTPLQFDAAGGATCVGEARVRITYRDRALARARPVPIEPLHTGLLNATTAARWQMGRDVQKSRPPGPQQQLPADRLRIRIDRTGIYALTYADLDVAGVPVESIDPTTFRLFVDTWHPIPLFADSTPASWQSDYELQEVAVWVQEQGAPNPFFDPGERIVFYALGPAEYADLAGSSADSLLHMEHPYDTSNYAWLVWDGAAGLRMQEVSAAAPGATDVVTRGWRRLHREENRTFATVDDLWFWEEVREVRPASATFSLDLAGAESVQGEIRIGIGAGGFVGLHVLDVLLNGVPLGVIEWQQPSSKPPNAYFGFPATLRRSNTLKLEVGEQHQTGEGTLFLMFDVTGDRRLAAPAGDAPLAWSARPAAAEQIYELAGYEAFEPVVLDVTDAHRPVRLTGLTGDARGGSTFWRLRYGRGAGVRTHFAVVQFPGAPGQIELRRVTPLRQRLVAPDMLIVVHGSLRQQADELATHRRAHLEGIGDPDILVVDVQDVYENFSAGRVDPLAIRNYVKFLYNLPGRPGDDPGDPRLRYLMLFGEATHDPRRLLPGTTPTLVPAVQPWYADPRTRREYAVDDWLVEMEHPRSSQIFRSVHPVPDLAVGRITPRSVPEARRIVERIIAYDTSTDFGDWRTRVVLSADDECTPTRGCFESIHIGNTENLVGLTPAEWDIDKIYLTEYPKVLGQKPLGRAAFIRTWSDGAAIVNYQGHGSPRQIADEVLFLATDIPSLTNATRLPVFMAFSCTVSEFDDTELQSMSEDMLSSTRGGAVATMGATWPTFATPNARYNEEIWRQLFPVGATSRMPLGLVHQIGKTNTPETNGQDNETYVLLGDPAMTLLVPEAIVGFEFGSGDEVLHTGSRELVRGAVHASDSLGVLVSFDGTADVEVFESADESGYTSADNPSFKIPYDLVGAPIYRGTVPVVDGRFEFEFIVPLGARQGSKARVSAYAYAADTGTDAKGALSTVQLVQGSDPDSSTGPPRILLSFPNNLTKVKAGTPLTAEISDENGVNIQGTTLPSSILLDFDDNNQPLNVTSQFQYESGSATLGKVTVPLPEDLAPGPHSATLIASDNLQNRATETIEFDVVDAATEQLANVIAFPNPFRDRTYFFFEVTDPADVTGRVYTSAGREVWSARRSVPAQQVQIRWRGVDVAGDELANGTYIYRVEARPQRSPEQSPSGRKGPVLSYTGKVVIMR